MTESRRTTILVVDDEPGMRAGLAEVLGRGGFVVEVAATGDEGRARLAAGGIDLLVTDLRLPGPGGLDLVRAARPMPAIVITAYGTVEDAVAAMKLGAFDFLTKPFSQADLLHLARRALDAGRAAPRSAPALPLPRGNGPRPILTRAPAMQRVLEVAASVASSRAPVLVEGESGTGKELVARYVHESGSRRDRPFVAVNCAALPRELLESELFGHERGAFTGAINRKVGKFELASGGTILLDEIGEMELGLQAKLLRVLQEYEVDRVGGTAPVPIDVRVIATTNRRLRDLVDAGRFRQDLFFRLSVIGLVLPPLRERTGDVDLLADHFLARHGDERALGTEARVWLGTRPWPGNVRELESMIARAALLARGPEITRGDLEEHDVPGPTTSTGGLAGRTVRQLERALILDTLERTRNNRTQAARLLGISIRTLRNKLAEYRRQGQDLPPEPRS